MRSSMMFTPGWLIGLGLMALLPGCGTNVESLLFTSAGAAGRTALDLFITDSVNTLADAIENANQPPPVVAAPEDDGAGDNAGDSGVAGPADAAAGDAFFASNGCGGCHCDDASGGCALDAPALIGMDADTIDRRLSGQDPHPVPPQQLSAQELADLEAYFASLG
jgi:mono/diheme cytochrome c family protein